MDAGAEAELLLQVRDVVERGSSLYEAYIRVHRHWEDLPLADPRRSTRMSPPRVASDILRRIP